ncbi:fibroblast growth factor-binding protein 2b [Nematolebias whitei]|uniref:fibroblast growth factor-binding protein 2b n=1 Tax=Nematolebias whitei TaxID=451745 RepID=UPI0018986FBD|nr:fibroblast growth factor-binding protein 2b [Nematolebias whitei]
MSARILVLLLAANVCTSNAQNSSSHDGKQQQRNTWDMIRFSTKAKESCTMAVFPAGNHTRLRVSCRSPGQTAGQSYYCDFQGRPSLCRAYNANPRHYFTQMMWELRKLKNACQGAKIYRPPMCKKYPDEAQMNFLTSWPKASKEQRKPSVQAQPKLVATAKPAKPQPPPVKPQPGKGSQGRKPTSRPGKTTRPTEQPESGASRLATEYCWESFHGVCSYLISWFQE